MAPRTRYLLMPKNRSLIRTVNARALEVSDAFETYGPLSFVCECTREDCTSAIEMSREEYEEILRQPGWFAVLPEHVEPETERVLATRSGHVLVEEIPGASRTADPLSS